MANDCRVFVNEREEEETKRSGVVLLSREKRTKKEIENITVKSEMVPIKIVRNIDSFSEGKTLQKEFATKLVLVDRDLIKNPQRVFGVEFKKRFSISMLSFTRGVLLVDIKDRVPIGSGFYLFKNPDIGEITPVLIEEQDGKYIFYKDSFRFHRTPIPYVSQVDKIIDKSSSNLEGIRGRIIGIIGNI